MKIIFVILSLCISALAGPLDPPDPTLKRFLIHGQVIQRLPEGLLVNCDDDSRAIGGKRAVGTVLVRGVEKSEGEKVRLTAVKDGSFSYTTVLGAAKHIDAFRLVK